MAFLHSGAGGDAAGLAVGAAALGHVVVVDAARSFFHRGFEVSESPRKRHAEAAHRHTDIRLLAEGLGIEVAIEFQIFLER